MKQFIGLRCLNRVKESNSAFECRHILAGVSLDSLENFDYSKGPFREIRFCGSCNTFWDVTINGINDVAEMSIIDVDELKRNGLKIPFLDIEDVFSSVVIKGRKIKGGKVDNTLKHRGEQGSSQ